MKNSKSIQSKIEELKNNVANQSKENLEKDFFCQEYMPRTLEEESAAPPSEREVFLSDAGPHIPLENSLELQDGESVRERSRVAQRYRQRMSMVGMEMLISTGVSYAVAWGVGSLFTLSSLWRIIMGAVLAFAVNALAVYRMIKQ